MRERFYHALRRYAPLQILDVVVPRCEIACFVKKASEIGHKYGISIISYGHAGDGNVHLHPLYKDIDRDQWDRDLGPLMEDVYQAGIACGGAISGEHGIGLYKKKYLPIQIDKAQLAVMKDVKKAFDPENILNPGKIFDI
jgi:glycolate oxidase